MTGSTAIIVTCSTSIISTAIATCSTKSVHLDCRSLDGEFATGFNQTTNLSRAHQHSIKVSSI
jgi:hypothetical protein